MLRDELSIDKESYNDKTLHVVARSAASEGRYDNKHGH